MQNLRLFLSLSSFFWYSFDQFEQRRWETWRLFLVCISVWFRWTDSREENCSLYQHVVSKNERLLFLCRYFSFIWSWCVRGNMLLSVYFKHKQTENTCKEPRKREFFWWQALASLVKESLMKMLQVLSSTWMCQLALNSILLSKKTL